MIAVLNQRFPLAIEFFVGYKKQLLKTNLKWNVIKNSQIVTKWPIWATEECAIKDFDQFGAYKLFLLTSLLLL
jgi:hypothetical protein